MNVELAMEIIKAEDRDITHVVELLDKLYTELGEEAESVSFLTKDLVKHLMHSGKTDIYLVKNDQKKVIGLMSVTESQAIYAGGKYGSIDEMYIKPEHRNKHLGKAMIDFLKELARKKGWKRLDVTAPTEEKWERSVNFYKAHGFAFTGPKFKLKL